MSTFKENTFSSFLQRFEHLDSKTKTNYLKRLFLEVKSLKKVFEILPEGLIIINELLGIEYVNKSAYMMIGLPDNCLGEKITRFLKDVDWNILDDFYQSKIEFSRQKLDVHYPVYRSLNFYIVYYLNEEDKYNFIIVLEDITDIKKQELLGKEKEKIKTLSMLAAGVAHELGNPLNSIHIHLQLLNKIFKNNDDFNKDLVMEYLNIASNEISRLDKVIKQFLGAVKPIKLDLQDIDIFNTLKSVLKVLSLEIKNRKINVKTKLKDNIPNIDGDAGQIHQAFYNIINNAIQSMSPNTTLTIVLQNIKSFIKISFMDQGKGIPLELLSKIFQAYNSNREGGTGLGLFIVDNIIRAHGGYIQVDSKENKGTNFYIYLPTKKDVLKIK